MTVEPPGGDTTLCQEVPLCTAAVEEGAMNALFLWPTCITLVTVQHHLLGGGLGWWGGVHVLC